MTPIDAAAVMVAMLLPFHWAIRRELAKAERLNVRACGIVIVNERILDTRSRSIGKHLDRDIWETVTFRGVVYRFERVQPALRREQLAPGELFLEPGLVYAVT